MGATVAAVWAVAQSTMPVAAKTPSHDEEDGRRGRVHLSVIVVGDGLRVLHASDAGAVALLLVLDADGVGAEDAPEGEPRNAQHARADRRDTLTVPVARWLGWADLDDDRLAPVSLSFTDHDVLVHGRGLQEREAELVLAGVDRDGAPVEVAHERRAVHRHLHLAEVVTDQILGGEDERRHDGVDVGDALGTLLLHLVGTRLIGAGRELFERFVELAVVAKGQALLARCDARRVVRACARGDEHRGSEERDSTHPRDILTAIALEVHVSSSRARRLSAVRSSHARSGVCVLCPVGCARRTCACAWSRIARRALRVRSHHGLGVWCAHRSRRDRGRRGSCRRSRRVSGARHRVWRLVLRHGLSQAQDRGLRSTVAKSALITGERRASDARQALVSRASGST